ncbi:chemotaxis protein [Desulfovibrio oxyclinae]|uniref:chemotaxis protein n=1 Tax=Desulfovibrio oxyclinae TaxID=63560 RepID=UPI00035E69DE|nr:chemotaxis protein [Desulfovibrio oxyclinae]
MSKQSEILLESGTNELEIVEFYLDEEPKTEGGKPVRLYYGINVAKVLEIIRLPELTEMPEISHPSVLGAFNLRNQIIPLIDLAVWLKKPRAASDEPKVIVTEFNRMRSAFLVSGVTRIHRINWREVEAPTKYVSSLTANSITGVVKMDNRIVFILDMEKICADLNPEADFLREPETKDVEEIQSKHYKLLLADDSNMARKMISGILKKAGYQVTTVENGEQAWSQLDRMRRQAAEEGRPVKDFVDAVVSDIEMPVMDGHNLTKRIKEDPVLKELPVVLCSSIITETLQHKGQAVGADDQVSKAELGNLISSLKRFLPV